MWNLKTRWMVMGAALLISGSMALAEGEKSDQVLAGPKTHQKAGKKEGAGEMAGKPGMREGEGRGEFLKDVIADLKLTQDQQTKVQGFMQDFHQKMEAFRAANEGKVQPLREQMKAAREAGDKEKMMQLAKQLEEIKKDAPKPKELIDNIKTVLTPDQAATLDAKVEAKKKEFEGNHPIAAKKLEGKKAEHGNKGEKKESGKKLNF